MRVCVLETTFIVRVWGIFRSQMQESNSGLDLGDSGKEGLCQRGGQEDRDKAQKAGFH